MEKLAYRAGVIHAFEKFALSPTATHAFELGGLGLLAAPVAHSMMTGHKEENPLMTKAKHLTELAGLGVLAVPSIMKFLKH